MREVHVIVGKGQQQIGYSLCRALRLRWSSQLWLMNGRDLQSIACDGSVASRKTLEMMAEGDAAYLVLENLPGASGFDNSGTALLRKLWVEQELQGQDVLSPGIVLTFRDEKGLACQDARYVLLFSAACRVVQMPFRREELERMVENALGVRPRATRLRVYLHPGGKEIEALETGLQHRIGNVLGAITLLHGAYRTGDLLAETWKPALEVVKAQIKGEMDSLRDYLALRGYSLPRADEEPSRRSGPSELKCTLSEAAQRKSPNGRICVLFVDNEANRGWETVLRCLLGLSPRCDVTIALNMRSGPTGFEILTMDGESKAETWKSVDLERVDLILLDLRLEPNNDEKVDQEIRQIGPGAAIQFSGMRLLQEIRSQDPGLPVIMLTASKKFYSLDLAKSFGNVWFLCKEPYLPGEPGSAESPTQKAEEHYRTFRRYVAEAFDWRRQNIRLLWRALAEFTRSNGKGTSVQLTSAGGIEGAIQLAQLGIGHPRDERRYYGASILEVALVVEALQKKKLKGLLQMLGHEDLDSGLACAVCIKIVRGAAAHAFGSDCLDFYDVLTVFQLFFLMSGVSFRPIGLPPRAPSLQDLIARWVQPSITSLIEPWTKTAAGTPQRRGVISKKIMGELKRNPRCWKSGNVPNNLDPHGHACISGKELSQLIEELQLYVFQGAILERPLQIVPNYMLLTLLLERGNVPERETLASIISERLRHEHVVTERGGTVFGPVSQGGAKVAWRKIGSFQLLGLERLPLDLCEKCSRAAR